MNTIHRNRLAAAGLWALVLGGAAVVATVSTVASAAPPAKPAGFAQCAVCHTVDKGGRSMIGPNLHGVVGAKAAARPGFAYSTAMKGSKIVWTPAKLDSYLAHPMKDVPGTKMAFAGVKDAAQRKAIIAYLASLK